MNPFKMISMKYKNPICEPFLGIVTDNSSQIPPYTDDLQ